MWGNSTIKSSLVHNYAHGHRIWYNLLHFNFYSILCWSVSHSDHMVYPFAGALSNLYQVHPNLFMKNRLKHVHYKKNQFIGQLGGIYYPIKWLLAST